MGRIFIWSYLRYLAHSAGRSIHNEGVSQEEGSSIDFHDVMELALGIKAQVLKRLKVSLAYGYIPNNIGDGSSTLEDSSGNVEGSSLIGPSFGDFRAIDRSIFAAGFVYKLNSRLRLLSAVNVVSGKREISNEYENPGRYDLDITELSFGTMFHL